MQEKFFGRKIKNWFFKGKKNNFFTGYSIRCYQCIQGFPAVTDDSTIENVPLPKNLSLPGVDHLPTAYCKTPFELKGNILCTAAHRCMKSVTYGELLKKYFLYLIFQFFQNKKKL